jgi:hypothetical protein
MTVIARSPPTLTQRIAPVTCQKYQVTSGKVDALKLDWPVRNNPASLTVI